MNDTCIPYTYIRTVIDVTRVTFEKFSFSFCAAMSHEYLYFREIH